MPGRSKFRFQYLLGGQISPRSGFGYMRRPVKIIGDIMSPTWEEPWDAQLGIAYRGENGPVYYTRNGIETTEDDLH
jgi:hypothetical protein